MPVKQNSRYAQQATLVATTATGDPRSVLTLRLERKRGAEPSTRHVVVEGETIDLIAKRFYGDEKLGWRILDTNPLVYPLDIRPGDILLVPSIGLATSAVRARRFT